MAEGRRWEKIGWRWELREVVRLQLCGRMARIGGGRVCWIIGVSATEKMCGGALRTISAPGRARECSHRPDRAVASR